MNRWTHLVNFDPCPSDPHHANSTPIYQTATFSQHSAIEQGEYDYSRSGNPTRTVLEKQLATLEKANHAFAFASGMAAITAITRLLKPDDHVISANDLYGGTHRLLTQLLSRKNITVSWVDSSDVSAIEKAFTSKTRLVLLETPTNPLQKITDLTAVAELVHQQNALLAVDNSLLSPWLQNPLLLGADLVVHSATKHLAGHGDVTAGVVMTNDEELASKIAFLQNSEGSMLSPFESWLLLRGLKTLGLRIERQQDNAHTIALFLQQQSWVQQVYYPGLASHPGFALHQRQAKGPGTVISFTTGLFELSRRIVECCQLFSISVSFGSLNSHISLPCYMSHNSIAKGQQQLPKDLIRLSIGIEDADDLINDLLAFSKAENHVATRSFEAAKLPSDPLAVVNSD